MQIDVLGSPWTRGGREGGLCAAFRFRSRWSRIAPCTSPLTASLPRKYLCRASQRVRACPARRARGTGEREGRRGARDRVTLDLRGLAPRLKAYACEHGRTPAAAIRLALVQALESHPADDSQDESGEPVSTTMTKVTLRVSADHATRLAQRARASERSKGGYVSALLDGDCPPAIPASHDAAIQTLTKSTDHLAVLSADLSGFLRAVGHPPNAELQRYRASVVCVVEDVRKHLVLASALMADIRAARRGRR